MTDPQSDEIPELEEYWDNGKFAGVDDHLINRHNTHTESERMRKEYSQHLLDLTDNEYYSSESSRHTLTDQYAYDEDIDSDNNNQKRQRNT